MAVTKLEFENWIERGRKMGATYLISVVDTFDWEDYPVFVMPEQNLIEIRKQYDNVNMQIINEVVQLNPDNENIMSEKKILEIYMVGFKDGLNGVANNIFIGDTTREAYAMGRSDAILGKEKILERIAENTKNGK